MKSTPCNAIRSEQRVWIKPDSVAFYQSHRQRPEDMYSSERFFLPELLPKVGSCLDVGCAAGGFSRIMKNFNPNLAYTGVDINEELIVLARSTFPESHFEVSDGVQFATPPGSFDLVFSTGILHVNSHYREIVQACYAQTRQFLLCDFRLTSGPSVTGKFRVDFEDTNATSADLPYIVLNVEDLVNELLRLTPPPRIIRARGYYHAPSPTATLPLSEIIMAFFLITKGDGSGTPELILDLPSTTSCDRTTA